MIIRANGEEREILDAKPKATPWSPCSAFFTGARRLNSPRETSIIRANGEEREILVQGRCETEGDTLVALFGFFQDITDRKTAEQALRRSEAFYRAGRIVEAQSELIFRSLFAVRLDGALTFVNEAFCRFFGVARNDAIGACLFEPDDPQAPASCPARRPKS